MELITKLTIAAAALLVSGWLAVSLLGPGRRRSVLEWLSATALYLMLLGIVLSQMRRAWGADHTVLGVVLGFLCALFGAGSALSLVMAARELRGPAGSKKPGADATH
jgi:hypothetical protein